MLQEGTFDVESKVLNVTRGELALDFRESYYPLAAGELLRAAYRVTWTVVDTSVCCTNSRCGAKIRRSHAVHIGGISSRYNNAHMDIVITRRSN